MPSSTPQSPTASKPLAPLPPQQAYLNGRNWTNVDNLGILVIGQIVLPLLLIGASLICRKNLSAAIKSQTAIPYTPVVGNIKDLSTTLLAGLGFQAGLLCYKTAQTAIDNNHTLARFLIDDLVVPTLNSTYGYLSGSTMSKLYGSDTSNDELKTN